MSARSRVTAVVLLLALASGCTAGTYRPTVVARGELTVGYQGRMRISLAGREVARFPTFRTLPEVVSCVPEARTHALAARASGRSARAFSILGAVFGLGAAMGFAAISDPDHAAGWLIGALASGVTGFGFALGGHGEKRQAVGHALDAVNFYNDAVGSLGATCRDLTYPAPLGPAPPLTPTTLGAPTLTPTTLGAPSSDAPRTEPPATPDTSNARPSNDTRPVIVLPPAP